MSKTLKHLLLPAREEGWELWLFSKAGWQLVQSIPEIDKSIVIPKDTRIALAASSVATIPLIIPPADQVTQRGIAQLQMEQSGLVKSSSSGSSAWDLYLVDTVSDLNVGVSLIEESITIGNELLDQTFDLAARFYSAGDRDTILCKQEQGRWVTIVYKESRPFYMEMIDSIESIPTQLKSLIIQFSLQGINFTPEVLIIEQAGDQDIDQTNLADSLEIPIHLVDTVNIVNHDSVDLQLIPTFVRLARKKREQMKKLMSLVLVALCIYAIGSVFIYNQHKQRENQIDEAHREVASLQPEWSAYQQDLAKLNELNDVMTNQWPLASFEKVVSHLPGEQKLRFQTVEIQAGNVLIKGVSPNINLINALHPALVKDPYFKEYTWRVPVKAEDQKTKLWNFTMEAIKKGGQ